MMIQVRLFESSRLRKEETGMWYARLILVVSVFLFFMPMEGFSHPGGTDADGCHVKNC